MRLGPVVDKTPTTFTITLVFGAETVSAFSVPLAKLSVDSARARHSGRTGVTGAILRRDEFGATPLPHPADNNTQGVWMTQA